MTDSLDGAGRPAVFETEGRVALDEAPDARVGLSTASVYPESTASGFEVASRLGYDAVEVMVSVDPVSQDVDAVRHLADYHALPVCAIHAPCLLITQRVWGTEPWGKLEKSAEMARALGAEIVVVHPPFRWQRDYAKGFVDGIAALEADTGVQFAIENMYPWRAPRRDVQAYVPGWNPVEHEFSNVTLDLSHTATAGTNPVEMAAELGDRLAHVHLADGSGSAKDEHLVPGRGSQPCAEFLEYCASTHFRGTVVVEINTRRSGSRALRQQDLAEALAFARLNLVAAADYTVSSDGTVERRGR
ncbi:MAG TPA: sugar phosphate isomerase/epimerase family protein [Nocardioidaceae bacterium]|nr:sugar phosphate isomerase/epimerase family protein [Nocardioidaceae bacterium]